MSTQKKYQLLLTAECNENEQQLKSHGINLPKYILHSRTKYSSNEDTYHPCLWSEAALKNYHLRESNYLYESMLRASYTAHKELFNLNWTYRSWRIYYGSWLSEYCDVIYDRYNRIKTLPTKSHDLVLLDIELDHRSVSSKDSIDFARKARQNHSFNYFVNKTILSCIKDINCDIFKIQVLAQNNLPTINITPKFAINLPKNIRATLNKLLLGIAKDVYVFLRVVLLIYRGPKVIISDLFLGRHRAYALSHRIKDSYAFNLGSLYKNMSRIEIATSPFKSYLSDQISQKIVSEFDTGDPTLKSIISATFAPLLPASLAQNPIKKDFTYWLGKLIFRRCKTIISAQDLFYTDNIQRIIANYVNLGGALVYAQHGGFAIPEYLTVLDHELLCSDYYVTWGWNSTAIKQHLNNLRSASQLSQIIPVGYLRKPLKISSSYPFPGSTYITFVRAQEGLYTARLNSGVSSTDTYSTIEACINIANNPSLQSFNFATRLPPHDYGHNENEMWQRSSPQTFIFDISIDSLDFLQKSKLVIYTYNNSTGWIEYLHAGIPTILFFNEEESPISNYFKEYFDILADAGIFHSNQSSVEQFLLAHGSKPLRWFHSTKVKSAINKFTKVAANKIPDEELFTKLANLIEH